jgi:hypothetical protein
MVFFTLWLQLNGFSNATSSLLVATFGAGVALVRHEGCLQHCLWWERGCFYM